MTQPINLFEYETLAKEYLSSMAWGYYSSGALDQTTLRDNRAVFDRYRLRPRVLIDVSQRDLSTSILGQTLSMPLLIAPMAFQCLADSEGEVATAQAACKAGIGMVLSTLSTRSMEEVAATSCLRWFQLYVHKDKGLTKALVKRAESAGYTALCLTVDAPFMGRREADIRNEFTLPKHLKLANLNLITDATLPDVEDDSGLFAYFKEQIDPSLTWKDVEWLRSISDLPVVVKGVLRADDAFLAVRHGARGVIISNHGGRQLDGAIASLDALNDVVDAVGEQVDVLMDGGIRRGTDILKALALGAKAVLVGRPILWGLAVAGESGVTHILQLLREELDLAMALSGCPTIRDIKSSLISY